jgi:gluconolactonase
LLAADLGPDGKAANPRVIHDFATGGGIDGMTVTTDGRIVAAGGAGGKRGVLILSPTGKLEAVIPTPEQPANLEFGGDDRKTLYISAGKSLYRIKTTLTGFHVSPW